MEFKLIKKGAVKLKHDLYW